MFERTGYRSAFLVVAIGCATWFSTPNFACADEAEPVAAQPPATLETKLEAIAGDEAASEDVLIPPEIRSLDGNLFSLGTPVRRQVSKDFLSDARKLYTRGDIVGAYKLYKRVLEIKGHSTEFDAAHAMAYCGLAECYIYDKNFGYAEQLLKQAEGHLALHSKSWAPRFSLVKLRIAQGDHAAAISEMQNVISLCQKLNGSDSEEETICREHLASMLEKADRYDEAIEQQKLIGADKFDIESSLKAKGAVAYYLALQGRNELAEVEFEAACNEIEKLPYKKMKARILANIAYNRAILLKRMGKESEADKWHRIATESSYVDAQARNERTDPNVAKFMAALQRQIKSHWKPPKQDFTHQTVVFFRLMPDGSLIGEPRLRGGGLSPDSERAALKAINESAPFPKLPPSLDEPISIRFTFDYNVFSGHGY